MAGAVGGMLISVVVGEILQRTGGNYILIFLMAGSAYLVALLIVQLLVPRYKTVDIEI
jgi:ACS family hexuronate transporter-like MFS transporter